MDVHQASSESALGGKYLTFRLDKEEYGVEILRVREIIGMIAVTPLPRSPSYMLGVINLRGKVIHVVDLRSKFGMPRADETPETCIIVVEVTQGDRPTTMGVVVDEVAEVADIPAEAIDPAPDFGVSVDQRFLLGVAKVGQKVIILQDINRVLGSDTEEVF